MGERWGEKLLKGIFSSDEERLRQADAILRGYQATKGQVHKGHIEEVAEQKANIESITSSPGIMDVPVVGNLVKRVFDTPLGTGVRTILPNQWDYSITGKDPTGKGPWSMGEGSPVPEYGFRDPQAAMSAIHELELEPHQAMDYYGQIQRSEALYDASQGLKTLENLLGSNNESIRPDAGAVIRLQQLKDSQDPYDINRFINETTNLMNSHMGRLEMEHKYRPQIFSAMKDVGVHKPTGQRMERKALFSIGNDGTLSEVGEIGGTLRSLAEVPIEDQVFRQKLEDIQFPVFQATSATAKQATALARTGYDIIRALESSNDAPGSAASGILHKGVQLFNNLRSNAIRTWRMMGNTPGNEGMEFAHDLSAYEQVKIPYLNPTGDDDWFRLGGSELINLSDLRNPLSSTGGLDGISAALVEAGYGNIARFAQNLAGTAEEQAMIAGQLVQLAVYIAQSRSVGRLSKTATSARAAAASELAQVMKDMNKYSSSGTLAAYLKGQIKSVLTHADSGGDSFRWIGFNIPRLETRYKATGKFMTARDRLKFDKFGAPDLEGENIYKYFMGARAGRPIINPTPYNIDPSKLRREPLFDSGSGMTEYERRQAELKRSRDMSPMRP